MWIEKFVMVTLQYEQLLQNVQPEVRAVMTSVHHALFRGEKREAARTVRDVLTQFVASVAVDGKSSRSEAKSVAASAPALGLPATSAAAQAPMVWIAPNRPTVYHLSAAAHGCSNRSSIPLAEAMNRGLKRCERCN
jgi:hypothetical protein